MKKINVQIVFAVVGLLAMASVFAWFFMKPAPVIVQGQVEATEIKVAAKIAGRVQQIMVHEGDSIRTGQTLAILASPEIEAKLSQAKALYEAAEAQNRKAINGAREEQIRAAHDSYLKAKTASELAEKTYQRVQNLYNEGVIPLQKRDEAEAQWTGAQLTEQAALAHYEMAKNGSRQEDKDAAEALVKQANGAVSEVNSYLGEATLLAPANGEISLVVPGVGELVSPGFPVFNIVDLSDVWVCFNLREDFLSEISIGKEFDASFPALGNKTIRLKVNYIHALGSFATWKATKATGDFDLRTFEIKAIPVEKTNALRPGMTAIVKWDEI